MNLTVTQAAERAGVARSVIIYAITRGYLKASRFGDGARSPYQIAPEDLDAWLERRGQRNQAPRLSGLLSVREAAEALGCSRQWLHQLRREGRLEMVRVGRYWYLPAEKKRKDESES